MPPLRTTVPVKAIKTERTHEENQERAYIAASRRSDRSLEARVESARRASEIHKRRTGRSLRVTEKDVINEEMYEEEDDDLPPHLRRLTAHLQTGSADFNRRLAAYLTNQVAMRSAIGQMARHPYAQHPQGAYQASTNMFAPPMMSQHNVPQSPGGSYRAAPYPSPHQPNFHSSHVRPYSVSSGSNPQATIHSSPPNPSSSLDQRRTSMPAPLQPSDTSPSQHLDLDADGYKPDPEYQRQTHPPTTFPPLWQEMGPFTTALPPESQQMLAQAPGFDLQNPDYAMLMHGSEQFVSDLYYPWQGMQGGIKGMPVHPSAYPGMSATLAPSVLEHTNERASGQSSTTSSIPGTTAPTACGDASTAPSAGLDFHFSQDSKCLDFSAAGNLGSGQVTPAAEGFWDHFVMDGSWEDGTEVVSSKGVDPDTAGT